MDLSLQAETKFHCYFLSEEAITIQFGQVISEAIFKEISNYKLLLDENSFIGLVSTVQAYTTLTVYYDPISVIDGFLEGEDCFEKVSNYLKELFLKLTDTVLKKPDRIIIPVCYDEEFGIDLSEIAQHNQLSINDVIQIHSSGIYTVYMIGFVPGFAYMGGMDHRITTPRKAIPRKEVVAGSVGIAGNQTGIYPLTTPGGWQILGRTPLNLFSLNQSNPALLKAGDEVGFKQINKITFDQMANSKYADQDH